MIFKDGKLCEFVKLNYEQSLMSIPLVLDKASKEKERERERRRREEKRNEKERRTMLLL